MHLTNVTMRGLTPSTPASHRLIHRHARADAVDETQGGATAGAQTRRTRQQTASGQLREYPENQRTCFVRLRNIKPLETRARVESSEVGSGIGVRPLGGSGAAL